MTWVAVERRTTQVQKGQACRLRAGTQPSGVGRTVHVIALRRHWITFSVAGSPKRCYLKVPVPWVSLDPLEAWTHTKALPYPPIFPPPTPRPSHTITPERNRVAVRVRHRRRRDPTARRNAKENHEHETLNEREMLADVTYCTVVTFPSKKSVLLDLRRTLSGPLPSESDQM